MTAAKIKVLFLPLRTPGFPRIYEDNVIEIVGSRHDLHVLDDNADLAEQFHDVDVVIDLGGSVGTREMLHAAASTKLWQILGMGVDHFDLEYWRQQGMPVAHCPGPASALPLAECAIMFMLMLARRYPEARTNIENQRIFTPEGFELEDRTLLLVGFGASARELAIRAKAFGMRVDAIDKISVTPEEQESYGLGAFGGPDNLDAMLPNADFVSLHLPLTVETRAIMNEDRLGLMNTSSYLINVARGELVDEEALVNALLTGQIAGAGLDVFGTEPLPGTSPLLTLPNVILTPHISGGTDGTARRRAELAAENCDRIAEGKQPLYRVV